MWFVPLNVETVSCVNVVLKEESVCFYAHSSRAPVPVRMAPPGCDCAGLPAHPTSDEEIQPEATKPPCPTNRAR